MTEEFKAKYGDFANSVETISNLNNKLTGNKESIDSATASLQNGGVFEGPAAASTIESLTSLSNTVNLMVENFNTMADLLTQVGTNFKEADAEAEQKILSIKDGKFSITTGVYENQCLVDEAKKYLGKLRTDFEDNEFGGTFHKEAWCADFLSYILKKQGYDVSWAINAGDENDPNSIINAVVEAGGELHYGEFASRRGKTPDANATMKPGDIFTIDVDGDDGLEHVGMVVSVNGDGTFTSIEGNTYKEVAGYKEQFVNADNEDIVPGVVEIHTDRDMSKVYAFVTPKK